MDRTRLLKSLAAANVACATLAILPAIAQAKELPPLIYSNNKLVPVKPPVPVIANGQFTLLSPVLGKINCVNTFNANMWNEPELGQAGGLPHGYGEITGWATSSCVAPQEETDLEEIYKRRITTVVSDEMPLETDLVDAEVCAEEGKTLSQCTSPSERKIARLVSAVRRRVASVPWKFEMIRGEREEVQGELAKLGLHKFGESGTAEQQSTACFAKERFVNPETATEGERPVRFTKIPSGCIAVNVIFPQIPLEFVFFGSQEIWSVNGFANGLHPTHWKFLKAGSLFSSEGSEGEGEFVGELHDNGAEAVQLITAR
jgi:hypothetical protein